MSSRACSAARIPRRASTRQNYSTSGESSSPRKRGPRFYEERVGLPPSSPRKRGTSLSRHRPQLPHVVDCMKQPAVYILASKRNGTLYVGVTSNLASRIEAHRLGVIDGFSEKYGVKTLVYFELHDDMYEAIQREKRIKKWNRAWKIQLIEQCNPEWTDLSDQAG